MLSSACPNQNFCKPSGHWVRLRRCVFRKRLKAWLPALWLPVTWLANPSFFRGWVKVPAEDVGGAQWPSSPGLEQEPALPITGKFLESSSDLRMKVDFPTCE